MLNAALLKISHRYHPPKPPDESGGRQNKGLHYRRRGDPPVPVPATCANHC